MNNKSYTITKHIAKHGPQSIIIIPTLLQEHLKPGIIAEIKIEILSRNNTIENLI